jgi:hypothetical protein
VYGIVWCLLACECGLRLHACIAFINCIASHAFGAKALSHARQTETRIDAGGCSKRSAREQTSKQTEEIRDNGADTASNTIRALELQEIAQERTTKRIEQFFFVWRRDSKIKHLQAFSIHSYRPLVG